jgi:photosystem II stability/assembly factor-like uncharacterized protein
MLKSAVKYICVAMIALAGSVTAARGDWEIQGEGIDSTLWDVCFVDAFHGWAVGNNSTIIHTEDGGKTWINQGCPIEDGSLRQVHFFDAHTGYAVCIDRTKSIVKNL